MTIAAKASVTVPAGATASSRVEPTTVVGAKRRTPVTVTRRDARSISREAGPLGIMDGMDRSVAWRSALVFAVALAVVAVALALALPHSFFEDWGWLAGPAAWAGCALIAGA